MIDIEKVKSEIIERLVPLNPDKNELPRCKQRSIISTIAYKSNLS